MSYNKTMEELLVSARELPVEFSYNEVEFLFLNPTPSPPARPWWRGGYLKFLLMLTLFVALLGFLLPTQAIVADDQLSTFLVQEENAVFPAVEALPPSNPLKALNLPRIGIDVPAIQPAASQTFIAPAAARLTNFAEAPQSFTKRTDTPYTALTQASSRQAILQDIILPTPLFTGSWKQWKRSNRFLDLNFSIATENGQQYYGTAVGLTEAQFQTLKDKSELVIERKTGTLFITGGRRKGSFEFIPNDRFRTRLNEAGMGDAGAPNDALSQRTSISPQLSLVFLTSASISLEQTKDLLWLEYFLADIDDEYLDLLSQNGYKNADLNNLWLLARNSIRKAQLKWLLPFTKGFFSHKLTIRQLASLGYSEQHLKSREKHGNPPYTFEEFRESQRTLLSPKLPMNIQLPILPVPAIKMIAPSLPGDWGLNRAGAISDTLTACCRMTVKLKGNFRIRLVEDDRKYVVAYGSPAALEALKTKISFEKMQFRNSKNGEPIDLEISATSLRGIRMRGQSQIYDNSIATPTPGLF